MKKLLFIYNSHAGTGALRPSLADILDIFVKEGYEVTAYPTQRSEDALEKTKNFTEDYHLVVCSGGDGTLSEVVNGMVARQDKKMIPIGYIPTGTTNDFARGMGIPKNMIQAAEIAVNGTPCGRDVGRLNDKHFTYVAAFGIFTDVAYKTDQDVKNVIGHLAYVLEGAKRVFNVPSVYAKVKCDDLIIEDEFIFAMVTNTISVGGFKSFVEDVTFDDGLFEVSLIKPPKNAKELNEILSALVLKNINSDVVTSFKASKISFEFKDAIEWTLDGEFGGNHKHVVIENKKKLLEFMVPVDVNKYL
jgi:YegS/Rv2252/BmrU family lipid kinase